jgi:mono/diheme cytochrome c family protein
MATSIALSQNLKRALEITVLVAAALVMNAAAVDAARGAESREAMSPEREVIPGADRMTSAEREAYRRRMAAATTLEEKARIRTEYATRVEAPGGGLIGDPVRGAQLHRGCFGCHGIERYVAPVTQATAGFIDTVLRASGLSDLPAATPTRFKGRVTSLAALREGVMRRNDYLNPKMGPQEIEDVVAYLNATYYKFPQ